MTQKYKYQIINQRTSSDKLGNCELCHQKVSQVFSQAEFKESKTGKWLEYGNSFFGHLSCLVNKRQKGMTVTTESAKYDC
jgi:hypothetical protein